MRPSGTHLYKRVSPFVRLSIRPSVRPYVRPSRFLKNWSFWHFSASAMLRINSNTLWYALRSLYQTIRHTICPSIYMYLTWLSPKSTHARTQSGRIVAWSGLFFCLFFFSSRRISMESDWDENNENENCNSKKRHSRTEDIGYIGPLPRRGRDFRGDLAKCAKKRLGTCNSTTEG